MLQSSSSQARYANRVSLKRILDLLVATVGLITLIPFFALVAWLILCDSPGPIFYVQTRSGWRRQPFQTVKFRTMTIDADARLSEVLPYNLHSDPRLYKIPNDPRITRVGAFLRRYSLDELPQLINVVRGEMSLVGPRPLMLMEDQHVSGKAVQRALVRPGITGLWQTSGRNELSFEQMMQLDCEYVEKCSLRYDFGLLLQTIPVIFRQQRAI